MKGAKMDLISFCSKYSLECESINEFVDNCDSDDMVVFIKPGQEELVDMLEKFLNDQELIYVKRTDCCYVIKA